MKFQNCILINFEWTHGPTHGQAQSNMLLQLFKSWGIKKTFLSSSIFGVCETLLIIMNLTL